MMNTIELPRFLPTLAVAKAVGRTKRSIQYWVASGDMVPDALLLQENGPPVALFLEDSVEAYRETVALKRLGEAAL